MHGIETMEPGGAAEAARADRMHHPDSASPPLANRGVDLPKTQTDSIITPDKLVHEGFDWLTATLGTRALEKLLDQTEHLEEGFPQRGFNSSSRRMCLGGDLWLKTEPRQASKRWGFDYASVEVSGSHSTQIIDQIDPDDSKATRLDYANDFEVSDDTIPEQFIEQARPVFERLNITEGVSGQGGINTCYIGSASSEHRVRVYRKDRSPNSILAYPYPVIRVETIVKGDAAAAIWALSERSAMVAAMNHVLLERTGLDLGNTQPAPPLPVVDDAALGQRVFSFVKQHGRTITLLHRLGLTLDDLADLAQLAPSESTRKRIDADLAMNAHVQSDDLMHQVRERLKA